MAEIIELNQEDAHSIVYEDHPDYIRITEFSNGSGRWAEYVSTIVQRNSDQKIFKLNWSRGLTENQDDEFYGAKLVEVEEKTRTIVQTYYEEVE